MRILSLLILALIFSLSASAQIVEKTTTTTLQKTIDKVEVNPPIADYESRYEELKAEDGYIKLDYTEGVTPKKIDIRIHPLICKAQYRVCEYNISATGIALNPGDFKFDSEHELTPKLTQTGDSLKLKYVLPEHASGKFNVTFYFNGQDFVSDPYYITENTSFNGTYFHTFLNESGHIQLNLTAGYTSGYFTQNVFDAGEVVYWDNISYLRGDYYGKPPQNSEDYVGLWLFDNNASKGESTNVIADESPNQNWGFCTNCPLITPGLQGNQRDFDGVNDVFNIVNESLFDFEITDGFSVGFLVYLDERDTQAIIGKKDSLNKGWHIGTYNSKFVFELRDDAGETIRALSNSNAPLNEYVVLHATYNGTAGQRMRIYINGYEDSITLVSNSSSIASILNDNQVQIGANGNSQNFVNAKIDVLGVGDYEISASQVLDQYVDFFGATNITVRSCDDPLCAGDPWNITLTDTPRDLELSNNRYFQYNITFATPDLSFSPKVYNVSIHYSALTTTSSTSTSTVSTTTSTTSTSTSSTTTSTYNVNLSVNLQISTYGDGLFDLEVCNHIDGCETFSGNETVTLSATRDPFIKLINPVVDTEGLGIIRFFTGRLEGFVAVIFVLIIAFMFLIYGVSLATAK